MDKKETQSFLDKLSVDDAEVNQYCNYAIANNPVLSIKKFAAYVQVEKILSNGIKRVGFYSASGKMLNEIHVGRTENEVFGMPILERTY